ncbi:GNAT family N-acetyltransferase [Desulforegula conservatrix]|uniref:GNAT family N-acetyltransferase n=1 Tax=Desulforegula conservatrix TaxID=153026 RepID=UPI0003F8A2EF|nr:GNAT family N-acetyltransferase [Desulforegula conservatrix]
MGSAATVFRKEVVLRKDSAERVRVRPATKDDIEDLADLIAILFKLEPDYIIDRAKQKKGLSALIDSYSAYIAVAEFQGRVLGMCSCQTIISTSEGGPAGIIEDLVVSPDFRKKGIGKALIRNVALWAEKKGISRLQLLADRDNYGALGFYRKTGWNMTRMICLRNYSENIIG